MIVAVSLFAATVALSPSSVAAQPGCNEDIFSNEWAQIATEELGDLAATASVYDTRSSCWYDYEPSLVLTTASAIKLEVLGANLDRVEAAGRSLNASELAHTQRMLWFSHNSPSTDVLYNSVGTVGMQRFSAAVGAESIRHTARYGATAGTAKDFTRVALAILDLEATSPLTRGSKQTARDLLSNVHFTQRWGISAGLPADHDVWLKNGFFPCVACQPFPNAYTWRLASTGYVERPDGTGWAITVLTDGASTHAQGSDAVEFIAAHVAEHLRDGHDDGSPLARAIDQANCVIAAGGESPSSIMARLQLTGSSVNGPSWSDVRWVSGNEGPMRGQQFCDPNPLARVSPCICPPRPRRR